MDQIRQQLARFQELLGNLTASQRLLVGALVVIGIMTMLYSGRFAGTREMEPLLVTPLGADEQTRVTSALTARGINFEISGGRIMVPKDRTMEAWSELSLQNALPTNAQASFDSMVSVFDRISPWDSSQLTSQKFLIAKQDRLQQLISLFPGVAKGSVIVEINDKEKVGVAVRREPSATISFAVENGGDAKSLAQAAANSVAKSVSGLALSNVSVTVGGRPIAIRTGSEGEINGDEILEAQIAHENAVKSKIENLYGAIEGLRVAVSVDLNTESKVVQQRMVDPSKTVELVKTNQSTEETSNEGGPGGEAGAVANMAVDAQPAVAAGTSMNRTDSTSENIVDYDKSETTIKAPAGGAKVTGVSVLIPRSYFVSLWKMENPTATAEPTEADLLPRMDGLIKDVVANVKALTPIVDDSKISVRAYGDLGTMMLVAGGNAVAAGAGSTAINMVGGYGKEVAVGGLALASLFLVSRMVKKAAPPPPIIPPRAKRSSDPAMARLDGTDPISGEVVEGAPVLMGQELDPDTIETTQMVDQISTLVKENPDMAAQLVKRWLNR
jgi:flagellar M-ring protein FliF